MGGVVRRLVAVVPVLDATIGLACLRSIREGNSAAGFTDEETLIVDNTQAGLDWQIGDMQQYRDPDGHNLGVAGAWNVGARKVLETGADYLVIVSASMLFGPKLHTTWVEQMERWWGHNVIEADIHSWHLIALHRRLFEEVGLFDENFHAYFEQIDWCYRLRMKGLEHSFIRAPINALSTGVGQHIQFVDCPAKPLLDYYADKWGGQKGEETFVQPWGNKPIGYWPEVSIPDLANRYGWADGRWW